jgi:hypothetical protein
MKLLDYAILSRYPILKDHLSELSRFEPSDETLKAISTIFGFSAFTDVTMSRKGIISPSVNQSLSGHLALDMVVGTASFAFHIEPPQEEIKIYHQSVKSGIISAHTISIHDTQQIRNAISEIINSERKSQL